MFQSFLSFLVDIPDQSTHPFTLNSFTLNTQLRLETPGWLIPSQMPAAMTSNSRKVKSWRRLQAGTGTGVRGSLATTLQTC